MGAYIEVTPLAVKLLNNRLYMIPNLHIRKFFCWILLNNKKQNIVFMITTYYSFVPRSEGLSSSIFVAQLHKFEENYNKKFDF